MNIKAEDLHQYGFNNKLRKRFERVRNNKDDRYWLAHTELTEIETYVAIKPFLKNSEYSVEDENSWVNKNELFYDPRFTLSIYLNAIKHKYTQASIAQGGSLKEKPDLNELTRIELPFNWVDWLDLTSLNEELAKPMDQRIDCPYIRGGTNNDPDPEYFCWDNIRYSDDMVRDLGFRNRNQLPRFIIHGHSTHDDRPFNDFRVMEAKCYALSQHLPKPVKVVILNGEGGTYEFDVKQNTNEKMITSDLIDYFIDTNMYDRKDLKPDSLVTINHIKEFDDLKAKVIPRTLSESEDLVGMYNILRKTSNPSASRELKLTEEMFHYNKDSMNKQIEELEAKGASQLTINEEMYLQSIKYCAEFPNSDDEETYFKMATIRIDDDRNRDKEWGWHYDWRFFNGALNYDRIGWNEQEMNYRSNIILDRLLRNWNRFAEEKGLISWIMHGPLLSWFWDGLMFPFDLDIDIQMPMSELVRLARDFNQTLIVEDPAEGYGKYFIDVGSFIHNRDISSKSNHIDARVVDVDSGIYIDVTALAKSKANAPEEYDSNVLVDIAKPQDDDQVEIYNDRRKHFYKLDQLSPLRYTMMGGVPVFIPSTITNRLVFEYSEGLTNLEFHDWYFVHGLNLWLKNDIVGSIFADEEVKNPEGEYDREKMLRRIAKMDDSDIFNLLDTYDEVLMEYYLTKDLTDYHDMEKQYLFDSYGRDNKKLDLDPHMKDEYNQFVSTFKMSKPLRKSLWDYENIERIKHHNS
ncbi:hypothetical protein CANTEDRAFT_101612 [Yamadazyma tenuis ATCC 10573]|uniref:LicD/FKTN/FKRP nucleotidyltransferase domain-containing protein n=1 Tax=Candida tenuis (strain ATCC 10573 / BCRC 21748 / CBS 615 / JCM 9827 / NBRC 10315 / NRRL Y-1498 / VKM Y-70) TaxID=590646 RepID=G3AZJ2_CANTC|nr:uncharacterized protein CANTEDRAFT_101612 [Yamadazyma tenuis ATCC 10573]EGV65592.1 hypothetical protein CANTEDRAFT_101612 [Yamadazyma tenuis ATCC 10573]